LSRGVAARGPGIRYPAPVIFAGVFLAGWGLNHFWRLPIEAGGTGMMLPASGWLLIVGGIGLVAAAISTLVRARTTFLPDRESNSLVIAGPFAISRNPIYVGMMAVYVGAALVANMAWPVLLLPLVWILMRVLIINREERYLDEKFGVNYADYRRRVRRWL